MLNSKQWQSRTKPLHGDPYSAPAHVTFSLQNSSSISTYQPLFPSFQTMPVQVVSMAVNMVWVNFQ